MLHKYAVLKFLLKNILSLTLLIVIPDIVYTLYTITQQVAELGAAGISGLSLIILLIKCIALEFSIRSLKNDYKEKIIFTVFTTWFNYFSITMVSSYYYIMLSGSHVDNFYKSLMEIIVILALGLQVIVIIKRAGTLNIYKERFNNIEKTRKIINFYGYVEIGIDMKLEKLNFKLGDFKVDDEKLYYKNHIFNYERFTHYIRDFNINITKMTEEDFTIAEMYCI